MYRQTSMPAIQLIDTRPILSEMGGDDGEYYGHESIYFSCTECKYRCTSMRMMAWHESSGHCPCVLRFKCKSCSYATFCDENLETHRRFHCSKDKAQKQRDRSRSPARATPAPERERESDLKRNIDRMDKSEFMSMLLLLKGRATELGVQLTAAPVATPASTAAPAAAAAAAAEPAERKSPNPASSPASGGGGSSGSSSNPDSRPEKKGLMWNTNPDWAKSIQSRCEERRRHSTATRKNVDHLSRAVIASGFFRIGDFVEFRNANSVWRGKVTRLADANVHFCLSEDVCDIYTGQVLRRCKNESGKAGEAWATARGLRNLSR